MKNAVYQGEGDLFTKHLNTMKDYTQFRREVIDNVDGNAHTDLDD